MACPDIVLALQWGRALGARKTPWELDRDGDELASMGPRFGGAENDTEIGAIERQTALQWGRALGARKTRRWPRGRDCSATASMGPRFGGAENANTAIVFTTNHALQWGRALGARKTRPRSRLFWDIAGFNGAALWGRGKRRSRRRVCPPRLRFNGAALWGRGKPPVSSLYLTINRASMGPRFGGAENSLVGPIGLARPQCFNGAALWGRGKPWSFRPSGSILWLQWGRALGARKTSVPPGVAPGRGMLQWGRALGARKTPSHPSGFPAGPRFNGAALWGRGKPLVMHLSLQAQRLQWGRALGARKTEADRRAKRWRIASMGPRFGGAENWAERECNGEIQRASMGPRFGGAENVRIRKMHLERTELQWGRALGARKTP